MPTFMVFKNGSKIGETVGANPPALQVSCISLISVNRLTNDVTPEPHRDPCCMSADGHKPEHILIAECVLCSSPNN